MNSNQQIRQEINTGLIYLSVFGKAGAGKSSVIDSLLGADIATRRLEDDSCRSLQNHYLKEPWCLFELYAIDMTDPIYEKMTLDKPRKSHGIIFVINSEPYYPELKLFELVHNAVPNIPKLVFVNKWDVLEYQHDENELNIVRHIVRQKINEKMGKFVKSPNDIIYGSARIRQNNVMVRQELPELLNKMYEDTGTLGQVMNILDPAHRAEKN